MSDLDFAEEGACRGKPADWFFPESAGYHEQLGRKYGESNADPRALALCADCPVIMECRQWGLAHEKHGIWGGLTASKRDQIRKRAGLRLATPSLIDDRPSRAVSMWRVNWTVREIATELEVDERTVHRWLGAAGIDSTPPRRSSRAAPQAA